MFFKEHWLASETYLNRKRPIKPIDYAPKKRKIVDAVIDVKKEKIDMMHKSIGLLQKELGKYGPIDITEDDIVESVALIIEANRQSLHQDATENLV